MEKVDLLVVGCGPAGGTAAREAARAGLAVVVLDKDRVVGERRVCAAGLRPGFCETFDLPRSLVHCDTPRLALFDRDGGEHEVLFGPAHTTTREELDGTIARLAIAEGADVRAASLFKSVRVANGTNVVTYADLKEGRTRELTAASVFFAQGSTAKLETHDAFAFERWPSGLMTTLQYRVYLERPASQIAYRTLELHYYPAADGRQIVAWMFPKRDHLAIGLGFVGKMPGALLRNELDAFTQRVSARLYPGVPHTVKVEGHLLYGGLPRPRVASGTQMVGGTAAGLVDATNGEGIFEAAMSGRLVAQSLEAHRFDRARAARSYATELARRFRGRLERRVKLLHFLERRPGRFRVLFEQLANDHRFADILQREDHERSMAERMYLYAQAVRFAARAARA